MLVGYYYCGEAYEHTAVGDLATFFSTLELLLFFAAVFEPLFGVDAVLVSR